MIPPDLADRIRVFVESLPGVQGFNLMLRYSDRVEMMGSDFPLHDCAEVMSGMVVAAEQATDEDYFVPTIN